MQLNTKDMACVRASSESSIRPRAGARRPTGRTPAFTLVEILIVVIILGILAAIVIPQFSNASQQTRESTLRDDLRYLRSQIIVFHAQHLDVAPGYPNGNRSSSPDADTFVTQMTSRTNDTCATGTDTVAYPFGPYLSQMPPNPVNSLTSILITNTDAPALDGSTGWIYNPATLKIVANLPGTDTTGTSFDTY